MLLICRQKWKKKGYLHRLTLWCGRCSGFSGEILPRWSSSKRSAVTKHLCSLLLDGFSRFQRLFSDMLSPLVCSGAEAAPLSFSLGATWLGDLWLLVCASSSIEPGINITQFNLSGWRNKTEHYCWMPVRKELPPSTAPKPPSVIEICREPDQVGGGKRCVCVGVCMGRCARALFVGIMSSGVNVRLFVDPNWVKTLELCGAP